MKKFHKYCLILIFLVSSNLFGSQNWIFKSTIVDGEIYLFDKKTQTEKKLMPFDYIYYGDIIKVKEKTGKSPYLVLIDQSNKKIEIKKVGAYSTQDLLKMTNKKEKGFGKKLMDFFYGLISQDETKVSDGYSGGIPKGKEKIVNIFMPKTTKIYQNEIIFSWYNMENVYNYIITIEDNEGKLLMKKIVPIDMENDKTKFLVDYRIDFSSSPIIKGKCYYWFVNAEGQEETKSDKHCLWFLDEKAKEELELQLKELNLGFDEEMTPFDWVLLAAFYDLNGLKYDAYLNYEKAVEKSYGNEIFKSIYNKFLISSGLYEVK